MEQLDSRMIVVSRCIFLRAIDATNVIYIYIHICIIYICIIYSNAYFVWIRQQTPTENLPCACSSNCSLSTSVPELTETHGRHSRVVPSRHLLAEPDGAAIFGRKFAYSKVFHGPKKQITIEAWYAETRWGSSLWIYSI